MPWCLRRLRPRSISPRAQGERVTAVISPAAGPMPWDDTGSERTLAAQGRSFFWARRFLSAESARRATRLYGVCRHLDDLADEAAGEVATAEARRAFGRLQRSLAGAAAADGEEYSRLLQGLGFQVDRAVLHSLLEGLEADLGTVAVSSEAELLRYAYRVAGTVGLMMCAALNVRDARALPFAIDLGIAMQLTNICRDVREDAERGRRYLPASLVGDCPAAELICPTIALRPRALAAVASLLALADRYYASGLQGLVFLPQRARLAIAVAARVYRAIGSELAAQGHRYWLRRAAVPRSRKLVLTAQALLVTELLPVHRVRVPRHDARLHAALAGLPFVDDGGKP